MLYSYWLCNKLGVRYITEHATQPHYRFPPRGLHAKVGGLLDMGAWGAN